MRSKPNNKACRLHEIDRFDKPKAIAPDIKAHPVIIYFTGISVNFFQLIKVAKLMFGKFIIPYQ